LGKTAESYSIDLEEEISGGVASPELCAKMTEKLSRS